MERAGKNALGDGVIGHDGDAVLRAEGQHILLNPAGEQVVFRLKRIQRRIAHRILHLLNREVRYADGANLALLLEGQEGFHRLTDVDLGIRPVDVVKIDVFRVQAAQAALARGDDVVFVQMLLGNLGTEHHLVAHGVQRLTDDLFGMSFAVAFRRVEGGDAVLQRGVQQRDVFLVLAHIPRAAAQLHAAVRDARNLNARFSEKCVFHVFSPLYDALKQKR